MPLPPPDRSPAYLCILIPLFHTLLCPFLGEGLNTTLAALEQKLLRGDVFSDVDHIERSGLEDMLRILLSGQSGMEYRPPIVFNKNASLSEREILEDRRRKAETAMNRLKSLYLYGDEEPSQAEFIIEREKIAKELTEIEARLAELRSTGMDAPLSDDSMIKKPATSSWPRN